MKIGACLPSETGAMGGSDPSAQDAADHFDELNRLAGHDSVFFEKSMALFSRLG